MPEPPPVSSRTLAEPREHPVGDKRMKYTALGCTRLVVSPTSPVVHVL